MFSFEFLTPYIEIIFPLSLIITIMLLIVPFMKKRYVAKARYFVWLVIAIRLLLPFDILTDTETPHLVNAEIPDYSIVINDVIDYLNQQNTGTEDKITSAPTEKTETPVLSPFPMIRLHSVIEWVWSLGSVGLLAYFTVQYIFTKIKMKRLSQPVENDSKMLDRLCKEMEINRHLKIYHCSCINSALIMGVVSPTIFIPDMEISDEMLEMVLRHELTHYKRKDILYKFVLTLACCMHWLTHWYG